MPQPRKILEISIIVYSVHILHQCINNKLNRSLPKRESRCGKKKRNNNIIINNNFTLLNF